jgi:hypothetical protein
MAPPPNRRELVLDQGRVFVEVPRLMTDDELADVFEATQTRAIGSGSSSQAELSGWRRLGSLR